MLLWPGISSSQQSYRRGLDRSRRACPASTLTAGSRVPRAPDSVVSKTSFGSTRNQHGSLGGPLKHGPKCPAWHRFDIAPRFPSTCRVHCFWILGRAAHRLAYYSALPAAAAFHMQPEREPQMSTARTLTPRRLFYCDVTACTSSE